MAGETPKLWSKLEDAGDVTSPQLGTGGAEVGSPTYAPAKFNNGILSDAKNEGCTFPTGANSINLDKGAIEFWAKVNYSPLDVFTHYFFDCFEFGDGGIFLYFRPAGDYFRLEVYSGGTQKVDINTGAFSWESGDLLHFAVAWDRQGNDIGGSKTIILKIDNVEKCSSTTTWASDTINSNLYVGIAIDESNFSLSVIDNLKTFDICKIDFSDKDTEGVGPPPAVKTLVQAALISIPPLIVLPTLREILRFTGG